MSTYTWADAYRARLAEPPFDPRCDLDVCEECDDEMEVECQECDEDGGCPNPDCENGMRPCPECG